VSTLPVDNPTPSPSGPQPPSMTPRPGSPQNPATPESPFDWLTKNLPGLAQSKQALALATAVVESVLDPAMWRSFGWLVLGLVLLGLGLTFWLKAPIESAVGTVGGAFAKAP
jgi:hypothetical protein